MPVETHKEALSTWLLSSSMVAMAISPAHPHLSPAAAGTVHPPCPGHASCGSHHPPLSTACMTAMHGSPKSLRQPCVVAQSTSTVCTFATMWPAPTYPATRWLTAWPSDPAWEAAAQACCSSYWPPPRTRWLWSTGKVSTLQSPPPHILTCFHSPGCCPATMNSHRWTPA